MKKAYKFFKRDISWLSFNYRVLLEAKDTSLPLYERINFISIYSSNLEEFYKVRVAEHKAIASGTMQKKDKEVESAIQLVKEINREVNRQLEVRIQIYEQEILPALKKQNTIFYQSRNVAPWHIPFINTFFKEEIFPYLQPVPVIKNQVKSFLRDERLYLAVRLYSKNREDHSPYYYVIKLPHSKVPRFIELPTYNGFYYIMYIEDIVKANLSEIFPGFTIESSYCIKISRDADIYLNEESKKINIVEAIKKEVKKRKIGDVCRFVYDKQMPNDFLDFLIQSFDINRDELVAGDKHINLEDLKNLPNPSGLGMPNHKPKPMFLHLPNQESSILNYVFQKDLLIHYPYFSFDHFIKFLYEAVNSKEIKEIMLTQYRVAENSAVVNALIAAAKNGKKVTVFVEIKARFDEEHNLTTASMMEEAGITILYSLRKLKVHAKVALFLKEPHQVDFPKGVAYISTGNFNEKTATIYADTALFTADNPIVAELNNLFRLLRGEKEQISFSKLLVAQYNLVPQLHQLIDREIENQIKNNNGRIILKMNALQDPQMICKLYEASQAGVNIDLIVRGICCLVPEQPYSKNIKITRIVDGFLEHVRAWYFGNNGDPKLFLGSPDWMKRNLYRRIEVVTPITDPFAKQELIDMLQIQLADNRKATRVDQYLNHHSLYRPKEKPIRAQYTFYEYLKRKNEINL